MNTAGGLNRPRSPLESRYMETVPPGHFFPSPNRPQRPHNRPQLRRRVQIPPLPQRAQRGRRRGVGERNFVPMMNCPQIWGLLKIKQSPEPGSKKPRTRWYRALTKSRYAVILRIERALPVDGQPLRQITQRSNRTLWLEGRLLLFTLDEQAANTDDNQTQLQHF